MSVRQRSNVNRIDTLCMPSKEAEGTAPLQCFRLHSGSRRLGFRVFEAQAYFFGAEVYLGMELRFI